MGPCSTEGCLTRPRHAQQPAGMATLVTGKSNTPVPFSPRELLQGAALRQPPARRNRLFFAYRGASSRVPTLACGLLSPAHEHETRAKFVEAGLATDECLGASVLGRLLHGQAGN